MDCGGLVAARSRSAAIFAQTFFKLAMYRQACCPAAQPLHHPGKQKQDTKGSVSAPTTTHLLDVHVEQAAHENVAHPGAQPRQARRRLAAVAPRVPRFERCVHVVRLKGSVVELHGIVGVVMGVVCVHVRAYGARVWGCVHACGGACTLEGKATAPTVWHDGCARWYFSQPAGTFHALWPLA